jgi:hypothetical protein
VGDVDRQPMTVYDPLVHRSYDVETNGY